MNKEPLDVAFLIRLAHNLTVAARDPSPNTEMQRYRQGCNELIHRATAYALAMLENEQPYPADEFAEVLGSVAQEWGTEDALRWAWRTSAV